MSFLYILCLCPHGNIVLTISLAMCAVITCSWTFTGLLLVITVYYVGIFMRSQTFSELECNLPFDWSSGFQPVGQTPPQKKKKKDREKTQIFTC